MWTSHMLSILAFWSNSGALTHTSTLPFIVDVGLQEHHCLPQTIVMPALNLQGEMIWSPLLTSSYTFFVEVYLGRTWEIMHSLPNGSWITLQKSYAVGFQPSLLLYSITPSHFLLKTNQITTISLDSSTTWFSMWGFRMILSSIGTLWGNSIRCA